MKQFYDDRSDRPKYGGRVRFSAAYRKKLSNRSEHSAATSDARIKMILATKLKHRPIDDGEANDCK
jgi:hypothetical protein